MRKWWRQRKARKTEWPKGPKEGDLLVVWVVTDDVIDWDNGLKGLMVEAEDK